jgi:hypothetical protein
MKKTMAPNQTETAKRKRPRDPVTLAENTEVNPKLRHPTPPAWRRRAPACIEEVNPKLRHSFARIISEQMGLPGAFASIAASAAELPRIIPEPVIRSYNSQPGNAAMRFYKCLVKKTPPIEAQAAADPNPTAILPGWKYNKLSLKAVPNGRTPGAFAFGRKVYSVPSGKAWACVCRLIEKGGFDSHGVAMRSPSAFFKREHRAFFTERMTKGASGWYIKTL